MFPELETERLRLREIREEDAPAIYACFSSREVMRYYGQEPLTTLEQAMEFAQFFAGSYRDQRGIRWGIEIKGSQDMIGTIGFNAWSQRHQRAELGYELHPGYWHKGYASEAASRVINYGFDTLNLNRIGAVVFTGNGASNAMLSRLGFQLEGTLRNNMMQGGVSHDTYVYSIVR